jgi:glycosyltransferase involved in cell wall biosynthesis
MRRLVIDGRRLTADRTGVGRYLEGLLGAWAESGPPTDEAVLVLHDRGGLARVPQVPGLEVRVVGERWPGLVWEWFGLGLVLRADDLLFAPTNLVPAVWTGPTALVLFDTLQEARPGDFSTLTRWRFGRRYRRAALSADRVIVPSRATEEAVRRVYGVPEDRLRRVEPAVEPIFRPRSEDTPEVREARAAAGLGPAERFFLFAGKRSKRRNVPAILDAFRRHRARFPADRLVFVGPGPDRMQGGGILDAGHVGEAVLAGLLASTRALLYPSEAEGFGLPIIEAMASGSPVLTLRRPGLVEAGGDAAEYLDEAEPEAMAEAMARLAEAGPYRAERVAKGLVHAAQFGRQRFASRINAVLRELAGD